MSDLPDDTKNASGPAKSPVLQTPPQQVAGSMQKEAELPKPVEQSFMEEVGKELELPPEVERAGVKTRESIEMPPDMQKMQSQIPAGGAQAQPASQSVTISLPIDDQKVVAGARENPAKSLRWLAEWCLLQLKKAHLTLKTVAGKIVRQKAS